MRRGRHDCGLGVKRAWRAVIRALDRHAIGSLRDRLDGDTEPDALPMWRCELVDQQLRAAHDITAEAVFLVPGKVERADAIPRGDLLGLARAARQGAA